MRQHGGKTSEDGTEYYSWPRLATFGGILAGAGLLVGYLLQQGLLSSPLSEEEKQKGGFGDFGEAGKALAAYANQLDFGVQKQREMEKRPHGAPVMEVDIDVDPDGVRTRDSVVFYSPRLPP